MASAPAAARARRRSRSPSSALAALLIVLLVDAPDVDATGLYGRDYEQAKSVADTGFRLETIGAILLLFSGVITSVLGAGRATGSADRSENDALGVVLAGDPGWVELMVGIDTI